MIGCSLRPQRPRRSLRPTGYTRSLVLLFPTTKPTLPSFTYPRPGEATMPFTKVKQISNKERLLLSSAAGGSEGVRGP